MAGCCEGTGCGCGWSTSPTSTAVWTTWTVDADNLVWENWNTPSVTGSTTYNGLLTDDTIWYSWNENSVTITTRVQQPRVRVPSEADKAEWARQKEAHRQREAERARAEAEAKARAEALLEENLTDAERAELKRERYLTVESRTSKRRYRIHAGQGCHGNIVEVDNDGRAVASLCCAPRGSIPEGDYLLAQKLHLEHNEEEFRRVANITPRRTA